MNVYERVARLVSRSLRHPIRLIVIAATGFWLAWLISTSSLPFALARHSPETALWLDPNNPIALAEHATRVRRRLLRSVETGDTETANTDNNRTEQFSSPITSQSRRARITEQAQLRTELREIAQSLSRRDPLNSSAFRMLAEVSSNRDQAEKLMQAAVARSRREAIALFWLLNDAASNKQYKQAVAHADTLLRTKPDLIPYVVSFFGYFLRDENGLALVRDELARPATWRAPFFAHLSNVKIQPRYVLKLMVSLKDTKHPVTPSEQNPFIRHLLQTKRTRMAYNAWLQLLGSEKLANVRLLNNSGFDDILSNAPFDWQITRGTNALAEITGSSEKVYHVRFKDGRVTAPSLRQVTILKPGSYKLTGRLKGRIRGKRGMFWMVSCLHGKKEMLAESDLMFGPGKTWASFELPFEVPRNRDCVGQTVKLRHAARSASEQFVTGELSFDDISVVAERR